LSSGIGLAAPWGGAETTRGRDHRSGGEAYAAPTPIGDEDDRERLAQAAAQRFGRIDARVGPAGVSIFGRFMSTKDRRRMVETDVPGCGPPA